MINRTLNTIFALTITATPLISRSADPNEDRYPADGTIHILNDMFPNVRSWKHIRDEKTVKQSLDSSCGSASLSTLLTYYYGIKTTEQQMIELMPHPKETVSFADMERAVKSIHFSATGITTDWQQLLLLKIPVIVFLKPSSEDGHFSVLRGIDEKGVLLADPSLGNRKITREKFLTMWQTQNQSVKTNTGRLLAVLPENPKTMGNTEIRIDSDFFKKSIDFIEGDSLDFIPHRLIGN